MMEYRFKNPYRDSDGALIGYNWNVLKLFNGRLKVCWSSTNDDYFKPSWREPPKTVRNHLIYEIRLFGKVVKSGEVETIWDWRGQGLGIHK